LANGSLVPETAWNSKSSFALEVDSPNKHLMTPPLSYFLVFEYDAQFIFEGYTSSKKNESSSKTDPLSPQSLSLENGQDFLIKKKASMPKQCTASVCPQE
jgi:hypothetical protein